MFPAQGFILFPLLALSALPAQCQTTLSGAITNENGQPIAGASLIVREQPDGAIRAFALSATTGEYSVTFTTGADSLWLSVSHLSFASQEKVIVRHDRRLDWVLAAQVYELPEIAINQPVLIRRGDTLVFDVNRLKTAQDEHIEEVLARIPGITVEPGGRILYQDLPISRFYIEGLDMLEGRYALATRNLNVDAIRDIEILEQHQPILALDSLISPPNAAINLRLKSNVVFTGEAEAGSGLSPALYLAGGNLFGFQKHQQFNVSGMGNNVGEQQRNNFRSLYGEVSFEQILVSPTVIQPPFRLQGSNALDNQELTGGVNFLRRISPHSQLKFQAFTTSDRLQYRGRKERTWRDSDQAVRFDELLQAGEVLNLLNGKLLYELNKPGFYTKASIESENGNTATTVDNEINARRSLEDFERDKLTINGRWEAILRKGNKAYRLWSRIDYRDEAIDLELRPLDLVGSESPARQLPQAIQAVRERNLASDTYTSFILRRNQFIGHFKSGIQMRRNRFASDLAELAADGSQTSLGSLFVNDMNQMLWAPYLEQDYSWMRKKGEWKLHIPAAFHRLTLEDDLREANLRRGLMVFQPHIEYLPRNGGLSAKFTFSHDYNQDQLFYNSFILRANRQFDRQVFAVNQREMYELSLRYQGKSTQSGLYYSSRLNLSATRADFIPTTVFDSLGQASLLTATSNLQQRGSWQNRFEMVPWSSVQIKLETNYTGLVRPGALNGNRLNILIHQAGAEPYLVYTFGKSVLSCRFRADFYASNISDVPVWQTQLRWVFFHQFSKNWGNVNLSFDHYRTAIGQRIVVNQLFNIRYKNSIPAWKLDVSLHLNNLTDEVDFITFTQESFYEELGRFRLRPRQFILRLAKKF
ncbi:MAG: TonB-dependent receptor [Saprospiraceae bacterium]